MKILKEFLKLQDKINSEWCGGYKYGHDYNILKVLIERPNSDPRLIKGLINSIRDEAISRAVS